MEFPFPPLPPEYFRLMAARWLCFGWNLLALYWLVGRVRRRKEVRATDAVWWYGVAVVGLVMTGFGFSLRWWIDNNWLLPLGAASISLAIAGATLSAIKLYHERKWGPLVAITLVYSLSLAWLLAPNMGHAPESYYRTHCKNNLRQIGLALQTYHDAGNSLPVHTHGVPPVSWRVAILPYIEQSSLHSSYDRGVVWDQTPNDLIARTEVAAYHCPSHAWPQDAQGRWFTAYSMPTGPQTVGASPKGTSLDDISRHDGVTQTLLVVEACGAQIVWTEPRDVDVSVQPTGINLKGNAPGHSAGWLSSYHAGGTQALLADGSVRFLSAQTDPAVLKKLATVDGGEEVGDY